MVKDKTNIEGHERLLSLGWLCKHLMTPLKGLTNNVRVTSRLDVGKKGLKLADKARKIS